MIKLYDHQIKAVNRMHNGCILDGGVGSGKSLTSLVYYLTLCGGKLNADGSVNMDGIKKYIPLYIITTARKRDTGEWLGEVGQLGTMDIIVDSWNNIEKYVKVTDAFFIFDEQRACGSGKWARTFIKISRHNKWIMLSATPGDSWIDYIPVFIANGFYRSRAQFSREHIQWDRYAKYPKVIGYTNVKRLIECRDKILVHMWFERPTTPHEAWVRVNYNSDKYKQVQKSRWNPFTNKPIENISEFCAVLRKITNDNDDRYGKIIDTILERHHAILFYNFDYELNVLRECLKKKNISFAEWNGHKHEPIPTGDNDWCYLVQYSAGSEGWNCITCDTVIFASLSYSYKQTQQAKGRIDRLNTPYSDLWYYFFYSSSSIDHQIKLCLEKKEDFNETSFYRMEE